MVAWLAGVVGSHTEIQMKIISENEQNENKEQIEDHQTLFIEEWK